MALIAIKTSLKEMPEYCEGCQWYACRPHPHKGWSEVCELECHCMDDDQPEEWIYDGNGRPKACPLIEVKEDAGMSKKEIDDLCMAHYRQGRQDEADQREGRLMQSFNPD